MSTQRSARVNTKLLVLVGLLFSITATGVVVVHQIRKRVIAREALAAGQAAFKAGQWEEAARHLSTYINKFPDSPEALMQYAQAQMSIRPPRPQTLASAINAYRRLLRDKPGDRDLCERLAKLYFALGDYVNTRYVASQQLSSAPRDVQAMAWVGKSLLAQQKHADAQAELKQFIEERDVTAGPIYVLLSESALMSGLGGEEKALAFLDQAVRHCPDSPEILARRASLYLDPRVKDPRKHEKARSDIQAAEQLRPDRADEHLLLADAWLELSELEKAQEHIAAAAALPLAPEAHFEFEREEARLVFLRTASRLALLRGDKTEALALAQRGAQELTESRRTQFLSIATQLYLLGDKRPEARRCLEEYHTLVDERARADKRLAEQLALLDAQMATAQGDHFTAAAHLENVVSVGDAQEPTVWRELGYAYVRTGQDRRAAAALERYLGLRRDDFNAIVDLARVYYRAADWPAALKWAQLGLERRPDDFPARLIQLEAILRGGRGAKPTGSEVDRVAADLQTLLQAHPRSTQVRVLQSLITYRQQGPDAAAKQLRQAAEQTDEPATALLQLAEVLKEQGGHDEAIQACQAAIERTPGASTPWITLAQVQFAAGRLDEATRTLEQACASLKDNERARAALILAAHLLANEQRDTGIKILNDLALERPGDIEPRLRLLDLAEVQRNPEQAQTLVDQVKNIEGAERGLRWRYEQARVIMRQREWKKRREEVVDLLRRVVENDPAWTAPVLLLGGAYEALSSEQQAEEIYRRYVESYPNNLFVVSRYLEMLERQGRYSQASQLLDRLPDLPALSSHKTTVAVGQRRYDEAIAELRKQRTRNPADAAACVLLARLTYHQSRHQVAAERAAGLAEAMTLLDEARQLAPDLLSAVSTRVMLLVGEGRREEALAVLDGEVQRRSDFSAYLLRAEYYAAERRFAEAERDYRHLTTFPTSAAEGYLRLGKFYLQTDRPDQAVSACEAGLREDSTSLELKRALARALLASAAPAARQRGRQLLMEMLGENPQDPALLTIRAESVLAEDTPAAREQAIALFEQVVEADPRSIQAHLQLIRDASARGDLARAGQLAARAIGANPDHADLLLVKAGIETDMQNYVSARELTHSVLRRDPNNVAAMNLLTDLALQLGEISEAEQQNALVLRQTPDHEDARLAQARITQAKGDVPGATRLLEQYLETPAGAQSLKCAIKLADLYRLQKDYARCEQRLDAVHKAGYQGINLLIIQLQMLSERRQYDAFVKLLEQRLKSWPSEGQALLSAATILSEAGATGELERLKPLCQQFIRANPAEPSGYLAMALLAYRTLDIKGAQGAYAQVLKLDRYHLKALNNLAWILSEELGRYDEALTYANTGVLRYPADPSLLNTRGVILFRQNKLTEAKLDLKKCLELPNTLPGTRARSLAFLGRIALRDGEPNEARTYLTQALNLDHRAAVLTAHERAEIEKLVGQPATRAAVD